MQLGIPSYTLTVKKINFISRFKSLFPANNTPIAQPEKFIPPIHKLPPSLTYPGLISSEPPNLLRALVIGMFKVYAPQWKLKRQSPILTVKSLLANAIKTTKEPLPAVIQLTFVNMDTQKTIIVKVTPLEIYGRTTTDFKLDYYISLPPHDQGVIEPEGSLNFNFAKSLTSKLALVPLINFLQLKKP